MIDGDLGRGLWVGYDKATNPIQVLPRKVPAISQPVLDVALTVRGYCFDSQRILTCRTTPWSAWSIRSRSFVSIMTSTLRLCKSTFLTVSKIS